jgi:hypothetical protein
LTGPFLEIKPPWLGTRPGDVSFPLLWQPHSLQLSHENRFIPSFSTASASIWTRFGHPEEEEGSTFLRNVRQHIRVLHGAENQLLYDRLEILKTHISTAHIPCISPPTTFAKLCSGL